MEYLLELRHPDGGTETVPDPGNPRQVAGAFGAKSVLEFPSYAPPGWLTAPAGPGRSQDFDVPAPALDGAIPVRTWSPADAPDDEPLPLLLVHDGPEYDALASLTRYLSAGVAGTWLPRLRAALLGPGPRDSWYSANASYARALRHAVIPALASRLASTIRVGMGTSLGGLAMLHAHRRHPDALDALFLQSGSFFTDRFDRHERRFRYYQRIASFVAGVHQGRLPARPVPAVLTCGAMEENAENNRLMARDLLRQWYYHPREWLKKVALLDDVYLLNSPFTFQSMEKHAAYCAMIRLGLKVPETVLVPYKNPVDNSRYAYTAARYNKPFDLDAIAERIGYPLFMKPYDGGAWRGVSRIAGPADLHAAYDACPDLALTSLHYYFPWAMKALVKWCVFALVTGRRPKLDLETDRFFEIGDRAGASYAEKLDAYRELADAYFESGRYHDFCASSLPHLDEVVLDWVAGPDFDQLLIQTVRSVYPPHEHDQFIAHLRGLLGLWVRDETARLRG